jgi:hypothetical protein
MSRDVRKDVSDSSSLVEVTERKMSSSFCWSLRGVPFKSRIWTVSMTPLVNVMVAPYLLEVCKSSIAYEQTIVLYES